MIVTPEQIVDSLLIVADEMCEQLYEHKDINADNYKDQIDEIRETYETCKQ